MARLIVDGPDLVVGLSWLEKLGAAHRNVRVPLRAIRSIAAEPHPWEALRGRKLAGTGVPRVAALGTRYSAGGRDFTALVGHRPAIRIELNGESPFAQLLVSVRDPESILAAIRGATGSRRHRNLSPSRRPRPAPGRGSGSAGTPRLPLGRPT